ncbi:MAG: hypothetical protein ACUVTZ_09385 [Armatimonadota bacterium]
MSVLKMSEVVAGRAGEMGKASGVALLLSVISTAAVVLWPLAVLVRFAASIVRPQAELSGVDTALACVLVVAVVVLAAASRVGENGG